MIRFVQVVTESGITDQMRLMELIVANVRFGELSDFSCQFGFSYDFCMKSLSWMNKNEYFDPQFLVMQQDFFKKLMDIFHICEDLENLDGLHMIYKIVRGISQYSFPVLFTTIASNYLYFFMFNFLNKMQSC